MIPELLWIIGFYVAAATMAHRMIGHGADERHRHYVLVAGNHQLQIEWYIRALQTFSRNTGTDIGITVVLENSSDDTGKIMEVFARGCDQIRLLRSGGTGEPAVAEVAASEQDTDTADTAEPLIGVEEAKTEARQRMVKDMEAQGMVTSPLQVIWVELGNREDLTRLPLSGCWLGRNRIQ